MSAQKSAVSRRTLLAGAAALAVIVGLGGAYKAGLFGPRGPYGKLLEKLPDRNAARVVGKAVVAEYGRANPKDIANSLHPRLDKRSLFDAVDTDVATSGIAEVDGWVLPMTLIQLSALAAETGY